MSSYTGIGSRTVSAEEFSFMRNLAWYLGFIDKEWCLRSGGANGSDTAFFKGANDGYSKFKIYIPWNNFNGLLEGMYPSSTDNYIFNASSFENRILEQATDLVKTVVPYWDNLKPAVKKLFLRNMFQVLGESLNEPSKFVLFCSNEKNSKVEGGTSVAINLARELEVPTFNLRYKQIPPFLLERVGDDIKKLNDRLFGMSGKEYDDTVVRINFLNNLRDNAK
ncbi:MAG: hypothetical protein IBX57_00665 [Gammaproteobacteria bacterium]|nr:hypothetical protein [Gammaproteobacteria bacterium]